MYLLLWFLYLGGNVWVFKNVVLILIGWFLFNKWVILSSLILFL